MSASRPSCRRCAIPVRPSVVRSKLPWRSSRQPWRRGSTNGAAKASRPCARRGSPRPDPSAPKSTSGWARSWCAAGSPASTARARCCWRRRPARSRSCRVNCWAARPRGDPRMLLAINANNTNIKFGVVDGDRIVGEWRAHTSAMRTADEHAVWLLQLMAMEGIDPKSVTDAIIGSVVPQANFNLRRLCTRYFHCEALFLGEPNVVYGIKVKGQGAGADRICNSVGASIMFPKTPVLVVDFGTSTNFDVVDEVGSYCGGVIAPGINLSIEALVNATALLPRIIVEKPKQVIGTTTVACMHSGVFWGYVGLIEGLVARVKAEFGRPMKVVATGGLAPVFDGSTSVIEQTVPDITARGLIEIFKRSKA